MQEAYESWVVIMRKKIDREKLVDNLNENRIYVFLAIVLFIVMIAVGIMNDRGAYAFFKSGNIVPMIKTSLLPIMVGIGFTYVMIGGNFDLSVGAVINVGAVMALGEFNRFYKIFGGEAGGGSALVFAWLIGILIALAAGSFVGWINGMLVAKGKVHSFIVTIGMLTAMSGYVYTYSKGNTVSADSYALVDVIEKSFLKVPYIEMFTLRFVVVIAVLVLFEILLIKTKWGKGLFMVGSNKEAAWQAGIKMERTVIWTFVISGLCAAFAGALFAISMNAAVPNYGERGINPLMLVLASTIIGGTVMTGGSGSVVKTAVAVITIEVIFNGLIVMGLGFDTQVLSAGIVLGAVVLFEAYSLYAQAQKRGQRAAMMKEAGQLRAKLKS